MHDSRFRSVCSSCRDSLVALPLVLVAALAASCATAPTSDITGDDSAFFGSIRVDVPFDGTGVQGSGATEEGPDGQVVQAPVKQRRFGFRGEVEVTEGSIEQTLSTGETVRLEDVTLTGPGQLFVDFDHTLVGLGIYLRQDGPGFGYDVSLGIGNSALDADARFGSQTDDASLNALGFVIGGAVLYRPIEPLAFSYGMQGFKGRDGSDEIEIFTVRLEALWTISDHVRLAIGLKDWDYSAERESGFPVRSDLELGLDGPFARLELRL